MNVPLKQKQNSINEQILGEVKEDILNSLKEQKIYLNKTYSETLNENMMMAKIKIKKNFFITKKKNGEKLPFLGKYFIY